MDVYDRFIAYWNWGRFPSVSEDTVIRTFEGLRFPLSDDACRLYRLIGGIDDLNADGNMFCVWSLTRIQDENRSEHHLPVLLWYPFGQPRIELKRRLRHDPSAGGWNHAVKTTRVGGACRALAA